MNKLDFKEYKIQDDSSNKS